MREIRKAGYVIKKDETPKMDETLFTSIIDRISKNESDIKIMKQQIDKLSKRGEKK